MGAPLVDLCGVDDGEVRVNVSTTSRVSSRETRDEAVARVERSTEHAGSVQRAVLHSSSARKKKKKPKKKKRKKRIVPFDGQRGALLRRQRRGVLARRGKRKPPNNKAKAPFRRSISTMAEGLAISPDKELKFRCESTVPARAASLPLRLSTRCHTWRWATATMFN